MKTLDLNAYGVSEMNHQEMVETDGGFLPLLIIAAVAIVASSCVHVDNHKEYNVIIATDSATVKQVNVEANASVVPKK